MECNGATGPKHASHPEWVFRREAIQWLGTKPLKVNLVPFAKEMALWLAQRSSGLPLVTQHDQTRICQPSNPYTYSLGAISLAIARIVNDVSEFCDSRIPLDGTDAEISRIRLESELVIYSARFCEAAIKQMLYCANFPQKLYKGASLGGLLAQPCVPCRSAKRPKHEISLLGALAHRYYLCHVLDGCAFDHLQIVSRRRNLEAAHSDSQSVNPRTAQESRSQLAETLQKVGHELGHMADHLGEIEEKMVSEIELAIRRWPEVPSISDLTRIPVRWVGQYHPDAFRSRKGKNDGGNSQADAG